MQYNTVVSGAMKLLNALEEAAKELVDADALARLGPAERAVLEENQADLQRTLHEGFGILLGVLYPVTPHIAHELWKELGYTRQFGELLDAPWPEVDPEALKQDEIELVLQINGKHRGSVVVPANAGREEIEKLAVISEAFVAHAAGASPKKVIVVPGRLVNVVL